jgi:putative transposase
MDAYSRLIVGWSIAEHMRTELVTDALGMAIIRRQPDKRASDDHTILHSDYAELCVKPRDRVLACAGGVV